MLEGVEMSTKRDYYEVLGINKNSTDSEIKKAYRTMAKQYHPDVNPGDKVSEAKFKEVSEAYEILSDSKKKNKYDQYGHAGVDPNGFGGYGGFEDFDFGGIGDIFESFFGGGSSSRRKNGPQKGDDLKAYMDITFEQAAFGVEKEMNVNRQEPCDECQGTGAKKGTQPVVCSTCNGAGQIQYRQNTPFGQFVNAKVCDQCHGDGKIIKEPCSICQGRGKVKKNKKLVVNIPAGIDDEQVISLRGEGEPGIKGGPAGDLYIVIRVKPHSIFKREGFNVICEVPITFAQAALGAEIEIPTLDGRINHTITEGTQTGTVIKFKSKGVRNLRGHGRGDHYVKVNIEVPKSLNDKQKELLKQFADSIGDDAHAMRKSFFDKMKDALGI